VDKVQAAIVVMPDRIQSISNLRRPFDRSGEPEGYAKQNLLLESKSKISPFRYIR